MRGDHPKPLETRHVPSVARESAMLEAKEPRGSLRRPIKGETSNSRIAPFINEINHHKEATMACYCSYKVRYRGRLVEIGLRYGRYNGAIVREGKPLAFSDPDTWQLSRETKKLLRMFRRQVPKTGCCP